MARHGVLADVHGNHDALAAALAFLDAEGVRRSLCLGDIVGYNADPDRCVAEVQARGMEAVAGNHDLIAIGRLGLDRCSRKAAHALRRTRRRMGSAAREYLGSLPLSRRLDGGTVLVHAAVGDVQAYVRTADQVARNAARLAVEAPGTRVCFFGHTHEAAVWEVRDGVALPLPAEGTVRLRDGATYFVNPGSLDSARRREPGRAELALFDDAERTVRFCAVPYDHAAAEARAEREGYRQPAWARWLPRALRA
jgi:predicted phosphodiesterase